MSISYCPENEVLEEPCFCNYELCEEGNVCTSQFCYPVCTQANIKNHDCACKTEYGFGLCDIGSACYFDGMSMQCAPCSFAIYDYKCICQNKAENCRVCDEFGCAACNYGYFLLDHKCVECGDYTQYPCTCIKDEFDYLEDFNAAIGKTLCYTCSKSMTCKSCINNTYYASAEKVCRPCPAANSLCFCGGTTDGMCRDCQDQYFGKCASCFDFYYLNESQRCQTCGQSTQRSGCFCGGYQIEGCFYCLGDTCAQCLAGWYYSDGYCLPCGEHCAMCVSASTCRRCDSVSYLRGTTCETCVGHQFMVLRGGECVCDDFHFQIGQRCYGQVLIYLVLPLFLIIILAYILMMLSSWKKHYRRLRMY